MVDPGSFLNLVIATFKAFPEYLKLIVNPIKNKKCHDIIMKHTNMISDLISIIGQTTSDKYEMYYNLVLTLEQTVAILSKNCY
ncbi:TVG0699464 [Thermoplasma volcanium GSS1]|uniref:TVG0699464 protein n=1 Tax=Thermoplasma volcanium (strain ATCC 51530 / DSM 4299 / JCM 9571 / NBRC 15438 / GSS1) TaxID=273116 RepID=Q97AW6_THEVO|nr:hypothetical protein [Thermoplasma volcanium]BAB59835.1 TVG0699464 [Thermoplasma volcanium GSS1]